MKILLAVHQFFPKYYTGTERFVLNVAKQLLKMGHFVTVMTYEDVDGPPTKQSKCKDNFIAKEFSFEGVPVVELRHSTPNKDISFGITGDVMKPFLEDFLKQGSYDIVHMGHPLRVGAIAWVARKLGIPVVATLTDFWLMCPRAQLWKDDGTLCDGPADGEECLSSCYKKMKREHMIERLELTREYFSRCDVITSPSKFLLDMFHKNGWNREIEHVRHGIDYSFVGSNTKRLYTSESTIKIGYIGTILYHKGVHILVDAVRKLKAKNIVLEIWGGCFHEGDYFKQIKESVGDDDRIKFMGEYDYEKVNEVLESIDIITVPSLWWENSPLTILTGFAAGIPALASNIGGMAEFVIDGETGFTFEVGDAESLKNAIEKILNDPTVLNELRHKITAPRIEQEVLTYENIYNLMVKGF